MGLLDKVKGVASDVAAGAKKGAGQIQGKFEQSQVRKKADDAAKQLGYLIVGERTGGTPAGTEVDRLVGEIQELERQLAAHAEGEGSGETSSEGEAASGGDDS